MASRSGRINTSSSNGSYFYVQWQLVQQDVSGNRSLVNWQAGLHISSGEHWLSNAVRINSGWVAGASIPGGTWSNISGAGDHHLRTGSTWINHNSDGSETFSAGISGWLYGFGDRSKSGSWALPTIPRATQPNIASSFNLGDTVTISLPRASSSFTHTVTFSFNGQTGTIVTGATTSASWTVPTSLANTRPKNVSGTGTITAKTYNGGTLIGTKTDSFTALIPDTSAFRPSVTVTAVGDSDPTLDTAFTDLVQSRSKIRAQFTSAGAYGSTITKETVTFGDKTYTGNDVTTELIALSGVQNVVISATDSRGRTTSTTVPVTISAYTAPAITSLTAIRTDATGTADATGAYALITMSAEITALANENSINISLNYKKRTDTTWTSVDVTPASGYSLAGATELLSGIDVDSAYDIELVAGDYFTNTVAEAAVPTAFAIMDFHSDGKGVSFGKVADQPNRFEVGSQMPMSIIAPTSTAEDENFLNLRRLDGTRAAQITTGVGGSGLKLHTFDSANTAVASIDIAEDGSVTIPGLVTHGQPIITEPVAFQAHQVTTQAIPSSDWYYLRYTAEVYNLGGGYRSSPGDFAAPYTGIYSFTATTVRGGGFSNSYRHILVLWVNGNPVVRLFDGANVGGTGTFIIRGSASNLYLQAGDVVAPVLYHLVGSTQNYGGAATYDSYFTGALLQRTA